MESYRSGRRQSLVHYIYYLLHRPTAILQAAVYYNYYRTTDVENSQESFCTAVITATNGGGGVGRRRFVSGLAAADVKCLYLN